MITTTQDEYKIRSVDLVHINPSILEGINGIPGVLRKRSAVVLGRFAPVNLVLPFISGSVDIPSTLTCNPGVWESSPSPFFTYQWYSNGISIPGATSSTWLSEVAYDATDITCEVFASNTEGSDTQLSSNFITISIVETINITEHENYAITGLSVPDIQMITHIDTNVITGLRVEDTNTVFSYDINIVTGLAVPDTTTIFNAETNIVTGLGANGRADAISFETYSLDMKEYVDSAVVLNPNAEDGVNNWIQTHPNSSIIVDDDKGLYEGSFYFTGEPTANSAGITQTVAVPSTLEADIDAGRIQAILGWVFRTEGIEEDTMVAFMEYQDAANNMIGSENSYSPYELSNDIWCRFNLNDSSRTTLPIGTRFIKITFSLANKSGNNFNAFVDGIALDFWRILGNDQPTSITTYTDSFIDKTTILMPMEGTIGDFPDGNIAPFGVKPLALTGAPTLQTAGALCAGSTMGGAFNPVVNDHDKIDLGLPGECGCDFGTDDFTIEGFAELTQSISQAVTIIGNYNSSDSDSWSLARASSTNGGFLQFRVGNNSTFGITDVSSGFGSFHFAVSRNGDNLRIFLNGVLEINQTGFLNTIIGGYIPMRLGGSTESSNGSWRGYIDNIRVTNGEGRYNQDTTFTVPTTLYTL